jgi:hypothetical protein
MHDIIWSLSSTLWAFNADPMITQAYVCFGRRVGFLDNLVLFRQSGSSCRTRAQKMGCSSQICLLKKHHYGGININD